MVLGSIPIRLYVFYCFEFKIKRFGELYTTLSYYKYKPSPITTSNTPRFKQPMGYLVNHMNLGRLYSLLPPHSTLYKVHENT